MRYLSEKELVALRIILNSPVNRVVYEYNNFLWDDKLYDTSNNTRSTKRQNSLVNVVIQGKVNFCQLNGFVTVKYNCL